MDLDSDLVKYDLWELLEKRRFSNKYNVVGRKYLIHNSEDPFKEFCEDGKLFSCKRVIGLSHEIVERFYPEIELPRRIKDRVEEDKYFERVLWDPNSGLIYTFFNSGE